MTSSNVIEFSKRRTYLDACRERGLFQQREEMLAEHSDLTAQLANVRRDKSAEVVFLSGASAAGPANPGTIDCHDEAQERLSKILDAYGNTIGGSFVPLLKHLILATDVTGEIAESIFAATSTDLNREKETYVTEKQKKVASRAVLRAAVDKANMRGDRRHTSAGSGGNTDPRRTPLADAVARSNKRPR
jgi:hypothetical protein